MTASAPPTTSTTRCTSATRSTTTVAAWTPLSITAEIMTTPFGTAAKWFAGTAYDNRVVGKAPQPANMRDYVTTDEDNGGVHINSGIPNHAFFVVAMDLRGSAWERAGLIWYVALRDHLRFNSEFHDAATIP